MTCGTQANAILREIRATWNALIYLPESKQCKMQCAACNHGGTRFAQRAGNAKANHCTARELTLGPQGPGED